MRACLESLAPAAPTPLLPELQLHSALALLPVWERAEADAGRRLAAPFWAFAWAGGQALARMLLDQPALVAGQRVHDWGTGGGVVAVAAAVAGATHVVASDVDPLCASVVELNAALNGVSVTVHIGDVVGQPVDADVVLAGDVGYDRELAARAEPWLRQLAETRLVLIADAERAFTPTERVQLLAEHTVQTAPDVDHRTERRVRVLRLLP